MSISIVVQQASCLGQTEHGMPVSKSKYRDQIPTWLAEPDFSHQFAQAVIVGKGRTYSLAAMQATIERFFGIPPA